ncbi:unnamed protein product [Arabidopsis arenosa]|uniref:PGG domain-containing protein n=1 Tax=Arabidopsis arenosa TaxID=38785 RepID=A0A8S2APK6_ARAAE|nr:unnamed protein product [Arabidopsis arenosa]
MTLIIDCCTPHTESVSEFLTNLILSDIYNLPGESVLMNPEIFCAMRAGNRDFLEKMRSYGTPPMACLKTEKGDSILHLAASLGHLELVESIISECPCLLLEPNWKDQIPIHAAVRAGRLAVVKTIVASITYFSARILSEEERERFNVYVLKDTDGEILLCTQQGIILIQAGGLSLVKAMLNGLGNNVQGQVSNLASKLEGRKSLVHVALKAQDRDILDAILNEWSSLISERDDGQTCLSFGASIGYYKGKGHVDVVKEILKRCPDSKDLLNKQGQNILHIAAKSGIDRSLLLKYIKRLDRKKNYLIQEEDADGNTPLHLATINWRPRAVMDLINFSPNATKIQNIENKDGLRPLDIAELKLQPDYVFRERLTLMILLSTYKPRGIGWLPTSGMTLRSRSENLEVGGDKYKDRVNILLLVATLVATVTFAAVAMQSSLVAIVALIWAQLGDPELVHRAFKLALPSLAFALVFMSAAFYHALIATTSHNLLLPIANTIIYSVFSVSISYLLAPYCGPYIPGFRLFKISMHIYLRILLGFVDEDDAHTLGSGQTSL